MKYLVVALLALTACGGKKQKIKYDCPEVTYTLYAVGGVKYEMKIKMADGCDTEVYFSDGEVRICKDAYVNGVLVSASCCIPCRTLASNLVMIENKYGDSRPN